MPTSPIRPTALTRRQLFTHGAPTLALSLAATQTAHAQATPEASPVATTTPTLIANPPTVRFDERFEIYLANLEPHETVIVSSTLTDALGNAWRARAEYTADIYGSLFLSAAMPANGTFTSADSMAFIWAAVAGAAQWYTPVYDGDEIVKISAETSKGTLTAQVTRTFGPGTVQPQSIADPNGITATYFPPLDTDRPHPAIIQIGGSEGGISPYFDTGAHLLNQDGYAVLNLGYWGLPGFPDSMDRLPIEYFGKAIDFLQAQDGIDPTRIGMVGISRGGEGALLTGAYYSDIRAVVTIGGSGLVVQDPWNPTPSPAWTWQEKDLEFADLTVATEEEWEPAEIPLEQINGPVLLIAGEADALWPSSYLTSFAWNRLQRTDRPFPDQFLRYPGAGHAFPSPFQPMRPYVTSAMGGNLDQSAAGSESAWAAIKHHFASSLRHWE